MIAPKLPVKAGDDVVEITSEQGEVLFRVTEDALEIKGAAYVDEGAEVVERQLLDADDVPLKTENGEAITDQLELVETRSGKVGVRVAGDEADILFSRYSRIADMPESFRRELASKNWGDDLLETLDSDLGTSGFNQALKDDLTKLDVWNGLWQAETSPAIRRDIDFLKFFDDADVVAARKVVDDANIKSKFPDMEIEELTAIYHYTTEAYRPLNMGLRSGNLTEHLDAFNKSLNKSLDKLPKYRESTYRGTKMRDEILADYKVAFEEKIRIEDKAFLSTSKDLDVAKSFADDFLESGRTKVFSEIEGKSGVDIENISAYGPTFDPTYSESEILFKSGTKFKVENYVEDILPNGEKFISIKLVE